MDAQTTPSSLELLVRNIQHYTPLDAKEEQLLFESVEKRSFKKSEVIFSAGKVSHEIYLVTKGFVRLFYYVDGVDKTAFFYKEGKFICAGESYTFHVPAVENYQALEDTELYVFTRSAIEELLIKVPKFEILARIATEDELISSQKLIASFVTKSAEQRYVDLLEDQGELFQRIPQQYIASFLGVSPETLSRIKARVHRKRPS